MGLSRGDLAVVIAPGSYGKARPAVIIQSNIFDGNGSLVVLLMTSDIRPDMPLIRYLVQPDEINGLVSASAVMIDKIFTIPRERMGKRIGHLSSLQMSEITAAVAIFLGM